MDEQVEGDDSDQALVAMAARGDADAFDQIVLRHQRGIAMLLRRFSTRRDVLEELTQTVFVKAYMSLSSYKPRAPFLHWLKAIAQRVGYDHWRQEYKRKGLVSFNEETHSGLGRTGPDGGIQAALGKLDALMALLKPDERQALYMLYVDGMSVAEVAESMGWNVAMTKMRSYRARKKLRKLLGRERGE